MTGIIEARGSKVAAATRAASRSRAQTTTRPGRRGGSHWWIHVVLGIGGFVMAFPFLWQIVMALSTNAQVTSPTPTFWPGELQWSNFARVFERLPFLDQLATSIWVTLIRTLAQIVLCTLAGYAFARMRFRGRAVILGIVLSILLVPSQVYLISQYQIVQGLGWLDSLAGIVAPGLFSAFGTFLMRTAFLNMPAELEEAARMDGANPFQTFWRIMLPLARPSISVLAITTVLWSWNELLWPLVVSTRAEDMPLAAGLATLSSDRTIDYPLLMAASLMAMAPVLILFIVLQRRVIDGLASSGLK
ncbi:MULTISPECIES: carbohydrate ABC transporter permease [unclassified Curtobacterium]|jgi:multiple sugar transport system permease protein|uniref:carbohydrate ABC transporter permease n=1 Tax=unclassified Curtobacterium TaxID=257496 RepID=UPI001B50A0EC|nr:MULTISPECIES: carbohydrate ABC transporter permease [unclassified Curtobacterium]MBP1301637.1 multiple sugar transport system permease protein [Curtobacterium sp. 1310]MCM3503791.1 carbohydrate ABC transporter permease [Curtobacterium sp. ODYSSEY 48 V2]MDB6427738.1 carbohydrate ABC transporter permease [Curtobacterium sp. 20TX0008]